MAQILFWAALVCALPYLVMTLRPVSWPRSLAKITPVFLLALSSWLAGGAPFLTMSLVLSLLGDFALSRNGRAAFLYGLSSFALAHLMFILLFQSLGAGPLWDVFESNPLPALLLITAALSSELWLAPFTGAMRWPVRGYIMLITIMGLLAMGLPAGYGIVALGAVLFIASDATLSAVLFRIKVDDPRRKFAAWALWLLYIAGQSLILWGIAGF